MAGPSRLIHPGVAEFCSLKNMAISRRWVGSPIPTPAKDRGLSPVGRQRHYGAVELVGSGEQVAVNDVVQVGGAVNAEAMRHQPGGSLPRLAQVRALRIFVVVRRDCDFGIAASYRGALLNTDTERAPRRRSPT